MKNFKELTNFIVLKQQLKNDYNIITFNTIIIYISSFLKKRTKKEIKEKLNILLNDYFKKNYILMVNYEILEPIIVSAIINNIFLKLN